ncbi:MAG: hypothetical protein PSV46_17770 [Reyranella sp.]|nr:hypothetical protein [Reyranella sp.]
MASVETLARSIVTALCRATDGRPQTWCSIIELTDAMADAESAVRFAARKGWLLREGRGVSLTDVGRWLGTAHRSANEPAKAPRLLVSPNRERHTTN